MGTIKNLLLRLVEARILVVEARARAAVDAAAAEHQDWLRELLAQVAPVMATYLMRASKADPEPAVEFVEPPWPSYGDVWADLYAIDSHLMAGNPDEARRLVGELMGRVHRSHWEARAADRVRADRARTAARAADPDGLDS